MATWNTPVGTIGNFTHSQSLTFMLSARTSLGGTIKYVLANETTLPDGLTLNTTTGVVSGTPNYVSVNTINYFSINAIETSNGIQNSNIRDFSINITTLVWNTVSGSIGVFDENASINYQFIAIPSQSSNTVKYELLNGTLPTGTVIPVTIDSTGLLTGTPNSEIQSSTYNFSIRSIEYNGLTQVGFKDRTFSITISISTPVPEFVTPSGILFSGYDSTWQSFQLQYVNQDPSSVISIQVVSGSLPPGLEINSTGLIRGYPDIPPGNSMVYSFTLEISSIKGKSTASYSITINNQETRPGYIGRSPVILNTRPLGFVISNNDSYKSYYLTSDSLGNYSESTEFIFKIIGYNFDGPKNDLTYIFNGPSIGLTYNNQTGWISGLLPTIGINVRTYNFTVRAFKTSNPLLISDTLSLSMTVVGNGVTEITWISSDDLGIINNGAISDLLVEATGSPGLDINYILTSTSNSFPPDLTLLSTGEISGSLSFESTNSVQDQDITRTYSLTIKAYYSSFPQINSIKTFTLTTLQKFYLPYDTVYIKALPSINDRSKLNYLLVNDEIIPRRHLYRVDDIYFGKSTSVIYDHIYGVPSIARNDFFTEYVNAVKINHYWRNITLGEIKVAVARDTSNNIKYEVVYSEIQDNLVNSSGQSISKQIVWPRTIDLHLNDWVNSLNNIYVSHTYGNISPIVKNYIGLYSSANIILDSINDIEVGMTMTAPVNFTVNNDINGEPPVVVSIDTETSSIVVNVTQSLTINQQVLFNNPPITNSNPEIDQVLYPNSLPNMRQQICDSLGQIGDQSLLPVWMTSQQLDGSILGFIPAWVICYAKPGSGDIIKNNIETLWPYKLNEIDFKLDRFEVNRSKTYNYDGTNTNGQPIWNTLPSARPNTINNDADDYIYFSRKTITSNQT